MEMIAGIEILKLENLNRQNINGVIREFIDHS